MQIKKYTAQNVQEALRQVKEELGPEALILSVKNIKAGQGPLALVSPARIEVTAAVDDYPAPHQYVQEKKEPPQAATKPFLHPDQTITRQTYLSQPSPLMREGVGQTNRSPLPIHPYFQKIGQGARVVAKTMKQSLTALCERKPSDQAKKPLAGHDRLASLHQLLQSIGLQEEILKSIMEVLTQEIPNPESASDSFRMEGLAKDILKELIKTSGPIETKGKQPTYIALVGPTGTGKTTTIAKLSAEALLKRKKKVALLTIDSFRVGALEQLNTYAGIMNIPVKQASTFEQLRKTILQYQDQDLVFIDTAGFSHHDREHLQLLNAFLAQFPNPEIHLVISANTNERELIHISQKFNLLRYHSLLFTKLDECSYPGTIFNHMVYTGKPLSYVTTGQKVPEDIELATPPAITHLLFHRRHLPEQGRLV